jgi:hypothetical protein
VIGKAVDARSKAGSSCPDLIRKQALRRTTYEISIDPKRISIPVCVLQMKWLRERLGRAMKNFESRSFFQRLPPRKELFAIPFL